MGKTKYFVDGKYVSSKDSIDLQKHVLVGGHTGGGNSEYHYASVEVIAVIAAALRKAGIFDYEPFVDELTDELKNNYSLSDEERYLALYYGGVNNWHGYEYAIDQAEEGDDYWDDLDYAERMYFLEMAGVDNWSFYSESIQQYIKEHVNIDNATDLDIVRVYQTLDDWDILDWAGLSEFTRELFG